MLPLKDAIILPLQPAYIIRKVCTPGLCGRKCISCYFQSRSMCVFLSHSVISTAARLATTAAAALACLHWSPCKEWPGGVRRARIICCPLLWRHVFSQRTILYEGLTDGLSRPPRAPSYRSSTFFACSCRIGQSFSVIRRPAPAATLSGVFVFSC